MSPSRTRCQRTARVAALQGPSESDLRRLDAGVCSALSAIFLLLFGRYAFWVRYHRSSSGVLNALVASGTFYLLLALPALWIRNTVAMRALNAVRITYTACQDKLYAPCGPECETVSLKLKAMQENPPPNASLVHILGAALAAAFLVLGVFAAGVRRCTEVNDVAGEENKVVPQTRRYVLRVLEAPSNHSAESDECCVVCLSELWEGRVCQLPCGHKYHARCITKWLAKARRPLCPLCQCDVRKMRLNEDDDVP